jgi:hypothetical protein
MSVSKTTNRGFSKTPTDSPDFVGLASSRNTGSGCH